MQIKVNYVSLVKDYTNKSKENFDLPEGSMLSELLDKIAMAYGKQFSFEVYSPDKKEVKPTFVVSVNGILMDQLKGVNTLLKDQDTVVLMTLMTGG